MEEGVSKNSKTLFINAWAAHARGDDEEAEQLFRQVLVIEPDSIETQYGLAIVLKAKGNPQEAARLFEKIVHQIEHQAMTDRNRFRMLRRLALGQLNYIRDQDWNLEREVWQR
ncbi:MAG: hypothetical protein DDG59_10390 [Anaerolineae bacterium]|jgi:thioredoxin-like negative regulator of GroEL|nr:MAG: hypothetical protein DDG59_10390 [Anaerolineae bacterium]